MVGKQSESTKCKSLKRASVDFFVMKTRFRNRTKRLLKHVNFLRPWERHWNYRTTKNNEMQSSCHVNTDHYHLENKQKKVIQAPYSLPSFGLANSTSWDKYIHTLNVFQFYLTYPASRLVHLSVRVISLSYFYFSGSDHQSQLRQTHQTKPHLSALSNAYLRHQVFLMEYIEARRSQKDRTGRRPDQILLFVSLKQNPYLFD